ncbi:hypothetical protein AAP_02369 [Ascosphaera apis ARSEF 7405]|uniref:Uncharacterized protein n=1 Tax=Ascosphaera apis ARSEF 7405 TaxID=392613 RepID=A0A168A7P3_9EURO|nr:hypothetical protein AAP_02369 [Ascosphaera apis ARSEF 7405]
MESDHSIESLRDECMMADELCRELLSECNYAGFQSQLPFTEKDERLVEAGEKLGYTAIRFGKKLAREADYLATFNTSLALYAGIRRLINQKEFAVDALNMINPQLPDSEQERILEAGDSIVAMLLQDPEMLKRQGAFRELRDTLVKLVETQLTAEN